MRQTHSFQRFWLNGFDTPQNSYNNKVFTLLPILTLFVFATLIFGSGIVYAGRDDTGNTIQFEHEVCELEVHNKFAFTEFHETKSFVNADGVFEQLVRFRGASDGHILLTPNANDSEPLYMIIIGSYNNRVSEIRRTKRATAKVKINTGGILAEEQWKGFLVRYNAKVGDIWVYPEGSDILLLYWKDPEAVEIRYFSFATYHNRILQVAFDCRATDRHSAIPETRDAGTPDPKIRKDLLKNYDSVAQPYYSGYLMGSTITVPSLNVIHYDIDDKAQTFELHAWIFMTWVDPRLRWAAYSTQDTTGYLHFTKNEIWKPDLTLYNTARPKTMDDFADEAQVLVQSNGTIIWVPPIRFLTNCKMNFKNWPFDIQSCYAKLGSWTFSENEIDLQFGPGDSSSRVKLLYYEGQQFPNNTEWVVIDYIATRTSKKYSCCPENYVDITYSFKIARKYSAYLYTVVHPVIMISILSILSFLLSPQNLARFIIGMLNILVISCYLIYFRIRLPTLDHTPNIVKLFTWNLFVSTMSILSGAIILAVPSTMENIKLTMSILKRSKNIPKKTSDANREIANGGDEFSEDEATRHDETNKPTTNETATKSHPRQGQVIVRNENRDFFSRLIAFTDPIAFGFFTFVTIIMIFYHL